MEEKHKLFRLTEALKPEQIAEKLMTYGYFYNAVSTTHRKQIYTVRKLVDLDHQYHLRFYEDGWVTGHYELQPIHPLDHLDGVALRALNVEEIATIKAELGV